MRIVIPQEIYEEGKKFDSFRDPLRIGELKPDTPDDVRAEFESYRKKVSEYCKEPAQK